MRLWSYSSNKMVMRFHQKLVCWNIFVQHNQWCQWCISIYIEWKLPLVVDSLLSWRVDCFTYTFLLRICSPSKHVWLDDAVLKVIEYRKDVCFLLFLDWHPFLWILNSFVFLKAVNNKSLGFFPTSAESQKPRSIWFVFTEHFIKRLLSGCVEASE